MSVAVLDSGVGGLSVLTALRRLAPHLDLVYLADGAWLPYGEKPLATVAQRVEELVAALVGDGADLVVLACNTASAAALDRIRGRWPEVPFVGMEPAVKPGVTRTRSGVVGVLATPGTVEAERFAALVERHAAGVKVIARPCPGLAEAIEDGDEARVRSVVVQTVADLRSRGADTIVLGCTHYGFVADLVAEAAGRRVGVVDPAPAVARRVLALLDSGPEPRGAGRTRFLTTGDPERFARRASRLLTETLHVERFV